MKYKNKITFVGKYRFASRAEATRFKELCLLIKAKKIAKIKLQPKFPIDYHGQKICTYVGDFLYEEDGVMVCEDVKGFETPVFKIKWKLVKICYPYTIFRIVK